MTNTWHKPLNLSSLYISCCFHTEFTTLQTHMMIALHFLRIAKVKKICFKSHLTLNTDNLAAVMYRCTPGCCDITVWCGYRSNKARSQTKSILNEKVDRKYAPTWELSVSLMAVMSQLVSQKMLKYLLKKAVEIVSLTEHWNHVCANIIKQNLLNIKQN